MDDDIFMAAAIRLSRESVAAGGGPFGAIVVMANKIIGEGANRVVSSNDPTCHAEIVAIRAACTSVRSHILAGATIYTSCEPCPMCLGAIWWARISNVIYGNSRRDAAGIGFDDESIYQEMTLPLEHRTLPLRRLQAAAAIEAFRDWQRKTDKVYY